MHQSTHPRLRLHHPHPQLDRACLQRHEEVDITSLHQTSRAQLLPNGHPGHVTRSQHMTSSSPSQLKSELTRFPSTAPPLRPTATTASASDTNDSPVGRRVFLGCESDTARPKMMVKLVKVSRSIMVWLGGSGRCVILLCFSPLQQSSLGNVFGEEPNMEARWSSSQSEWSKLSRVAEKQASEK